jgi:hypothetical protein
MGIPPSAGEGAGHGGVHGRGPHGVGGAGRAGPSLFAHTVPVYLRDQSLPWRPLDCSTSSYCSCVLSLA